MVYNTIETAICSIGHQWTKDIQFFFWSIWIFSKTFQPNLQRIKSWLFFYRSLSFSPSELNIIICGLTPHVSLKSILIPVSILLLSPPGPSYHHITSSPTPSMSYSVTPHYDNVHCMPSGRENKAISKDSLQNKILLLSCHKSSDRLQSITW